MPKVIKTKNLTLTKVNKQEFLVVYKKTGEDWFVDKDGNGSTPEKYWDSPIENEIFCALGLN